MEQNRCAHCGFAMDLNPRLNKQLYCGRQEGQRARKRSWQKRKMAIDPDYKANQQSCNKAWQERNPDCWRNYRASHPGYAERNRLQQKARRSRGQPRGVAKMDASAPDSFVRTGTYWLIPEEGDAKIDALARKVALIPVT